MAASVQRRLTAILSADAVGYSRLMAQDEEGTARMLAACRHLISDRVGQRAGRVVDAPGDNLLAEFPSVVDAVRCAVGIQQELKRRNAELPPNQRLLYRMGVNLGDIIVEGDRILGDGVNVAARLESLAEPGGICISGTAFDQVEGKLALAFEDAGEQTVKNIPRQIRVYRVRPDEAAEATRWREPSSRTVRKTGVAAALVAVAVGLAVLAVTYFALDTSLWVDASTTTEGAAEDRKSIAVLPFENMSRDAINEPFALGIHDDLLTHLSKIGSLKTISRTSVLQYRNTTKTIPRIASELGVATILEGAVQRAGDRVRINVQLIDAATDEHLWSATYDRQLTASNIFSIQSEIATAIANALRATLSQDEQRRLDFTPTQNLAAVETYFLGKQLLEKRTRESLSAAVEYFQQVIELDPGFAPAHSGLADAYMLLPEYSASMDWEVAREKSEAAANRALTLDPDLPEALSSMGWNRLIHYYDWNGAEALLRRALAVQSNNTNALHWLSHVLSWQGQHAEAIEWARRAVEVDPLSSLMRMNQSYILMDAEDFDQAFEIGLAELRHDPNYPERLGNLWLTYLRAGRPEEAAAFMQQWAAATGRDVEAAREIGEAFIRHWETGERQPLANELVDRLEFGSEDLGQVYAFVGDGERALGALERAYAERSGSRSLLSMKVNPGYDFIRDDPRFVELMQRVGLRPASGPE